MIRHKVCIVCGADFVAKSNKGLYCKPVCGSAAYKKRNPDKVKVRRNKWYDKNRDAQNEYKRENMREYNRTYWAERRKNDPDFRLKNNLRNRFNSMLRNGYKKSSVLTYVGCPFEHLKLHLQSLFKDGMTWDNYGEWHVDHILPLIAFSSTEEDLRKVWHYSNLQPLWAIDNLKKGDKVCG